ncbi:PaaI family thioesterase [Marinobacter sp. TBZ242]|uniref:Medium/long-chain acyl-CoA thioesterase YigI n=1 Tax=Marinobacter azerbaijanicus TaxID=3050455 RepID=A0ABT7I8G2_9GAMM|nr:PaaI family thioesterase [Marinobacter sp. TBZ242]MDL0430451.1 PaaI family thioesterase [Marinobacter sp. TBZ242]
MDSFNKNEVERIFSSAPFIADMGLELVAIESGECRSRLVLANRHLQQDGFVHFGVQATVADHTAGAAGASTAKPGQIVLTSDFSLKLLRSARGTHLECIATVLKAGSSLTVVESEVYCGTADDMRLVSKAMVTLAVVSPRGQNPG